MLFNPSLKSLVPFLPNKIFIRIVFYKNSVNKSNLFSWISSVMTVPFFWINLNCLRGDVVSGFGSYRHMTRQRLRLKRLSLVQGVLSDDRSF